jgi:hypothetical protein
MVFGGVLRSGGNTIVIGGSLQILPNSVIEIVLPVVVPSSRNARSTTTVTTVVASYSGGVSGTASSVVVTSASSCVDVMSPQVSYGSSSLAVTVQVDDSRCAATSTLSEGAIAGKFCFVLLFRLFFYSKIFSKGIVVGSVVVAALIVAIVIAVVVHERKSRTAMNQVFEKIHLEKR